jgi:hypothetical protein
MNSIDELVLAMRTILQAGLRTVEAESVSDYRARLGQQVVDRLDALKPLLYQTGSEGKTLILAGQLPPLVDLASALRSGPVAEWQAFCRAHDLAIEPSWESGPIEQIAVLEARGVSPTHALYREYRAARSKQDTAAALKVLRVISRLSPHDEDSREEVLRLEGLVPADAAATFSVPSTVRPAAVQMQPAVSSPRPAPAASGAPVRTIDPLPSVGAAPTPAPPNPVRKIHAGSAPPAPPPAPPLVVGAAEVPPIVPESPPEPPSPVARSLSSARVIQSPVPNAAGPVSRLKKADSDSGMNGLDDEARLHRALEAERAAPLVMVPSGEKPFPLRLVLRLSAGLVMLIVVGVGVKLTLDASARARQTKQDVALWQGVARQAFNGVLDMEQTQTALQRAAETPATGKAIVKAHETCLKNVRLFLSDPMSADMPEAPPEAAEDLQGLISTLNSYYEICEATPLPEEWNPLSLDDFAKYLRWQAKEEEQWQEVANCFAPTPDRPEAIADRRVREMEQLRLTAEKLLTGDTHPPGTPDKWLELLTDLDALVPVWLPIWAKWEAWDRDDLDYLRSLGSMVQDAPSTPQWLRQSMVQEIKKTLRTATP